MPLKYKIAEIISLYQESTRFPQQQIFKESTKPEWYFY